MLGGATEVAGGGAIRSNHELSRLLRDQAPRTAHMKEAKT